VNDYLAAARLHLVDRLTFTVLPWAVLMFTFGVNMVIFAVVHPPNGKFTGALFTLPCFMVVLGVISLTRSLPFALMLGITRRYYYLGTVGLAAVVSAAWACVVTVLNLLEGASGGWGIGLHFFRVPWILPGAWYQVLLTSFVVLTVSFLTGMWAGLIYRRWGLPGMLIAIGSVVLVGLALVLIASWQQAWLAIGRYLGGIDPYTVTGLLAAVAALLTLGGFATIRRAAV
jgi:hypothetical protein